MTARQRKAQRHHLKHRQGETPAAPTPEIPNLDLGNFDEPQTTPLPAVPTLDGSTFDPSPVVAPPPAAPLIPHAISIPRGFAEARGAR
jgi:hypothetical protein